MSRISIDTRLKAYTVMELMVVSMLSILCVIAAINVIGLFQQQFFSYEKETTSALALADLQILLQEDFFNASEIERTTEGLVFTFPYHQIKYETSEEFIVREILAGAVRRDTTFVRLSALSTYFDGRAVNEGPLSGAQIIVQYGNRPMTISLKKELGAKNLIDTEDGY